MAIGPAGTSVADVKGVMDLAAGVAGKGVDVIDATLLVLGASGLMSSG